MVPENHEVNSVYLEGADEKLSARRAGQFASIRVPRQDGWSEPHPFTISAAPEDALLRLTIKKEGIHLRHPQSDAGHAREGRRPLGVFCRGIDEKPEIVMIAGGVGITPFLSVLRHFRGGKAKNRVLLFWANKTLSETFCLDEIRAMTRELDLTVVHCLSREESVDGHFDAGTPGMLFEKGRISADILSGTA